MWPCSLAFMMMRSMWIRLLVPLRNLLIAKECQCMTTQMLWHIREVNSMFADKRKKVRERYKEYDGCYLRPLRSNAMQIPSLRKEPTAYSIRRDDDFSLLIMFQEVPQAACMVTMPMRYENIVNITDIYAQQLCIFCHIPLLSLLKSLFSYSSPILN